MADVNRALRPEALQSLHFLAHAGTHYEDKGDAYVVTDASGRALTTRSATVREGILRLAARYPASATLEDCCDSGPDRGQVLDALYRMVMAGMLTIASEPVCAVAHPGDRPIALPLARADGADGAASTANLRHESVELDAATRMLLPAMDVSRDRAALTAKLAKAAQAGKVSFSRNGAPIRNPAEIRKAAQEHLPRLLAGIANASLLQA